MERYLPELSEPARRWLRFLAVVVALTALCWATYQLSAVVTPIVVALAIAYILNPVVTYFERAHRIARLHTVVAVYALLVVVVLIGGSYLISRTVAQIAVFSKNVPTYVDRIGAWIGVDEPSAQLATTQPVPVDAAATGEAEAAPSGESGAVPATTMPATAPASQPAHDWIDEWWGFAKPTLTQHGVNLARRALNIVTSALLSVVNWVTLLVLIPLYVFFFLWHFNDITGAVRDHLPAAYRDQIVHVVATIDAAVANFFRGRLIVCSLIGVLTALGYTFVGVPYSLPLGLLAGALSLIPYMSMLALPPALFFAYVAATDAGQPWFWPVVLVMGVYMLVQALESFLLSPMIEGKSSGLHPVVIVIAIMIGAQLAGLLGMLLAIPVASTLKTLGAELLLPELRRVAGHAPDEPPSDAEGPPPENAENATEERDT